MNDTPPNDGYRPPLGTPASIASQAQDAVWAGIFGNTSDAILNAFPELRNYTPVPAWYPINLVLGGEDGNFVRGTVGLRPEPFVLRRITYACTGDVAGGDSQEPYLPVPLSQGSDQARTVELEWGDDFTTFVGPDPMLVAAVFADSNGFLDVPGLALFQGSQNLWVRLTRIAWTQDDETLERIPTEWDFVFSGFGLLPKGVNQSGSVG